MFYYTPRECNINLELKLSSLTADCQCRDNGPCAKYSLHVFVLCACVLMGGKTIKSEFQDAIHPHVSFMLCYAMDTSSAFVSMLFFGRHEFGVKYQNTNPSENWLV